MTYNPNLSPEYIVALEKSREAGRVFGIIQKAYRAREIGDAEYLAGRAIYMASSAEFDVAYAKEEARTD